MKMALPHQDQLQHWLGACGFNVSVLVFALRTACAGFAALVIAYALGLEHPHWAAMSAWASSQPMREHLLSRGIYRVAGSVVGVVFALALVLTAQDAIWLTAIGLAMWTAVCAFLGNLQRGYLVYGCMLAGYSAAMVVLLHHGTVDGIWPFAADRLLTVIAGVLSALCISWCFAPRRKATVLIEQSRHALAQVLQAMVVRLRGEGSNQRQDHYSLLVKLAEVEELLELYPEGSRTARNTSKAMHWQQHQALELVYYLEQSSADGVMAQPTLPLAIALEEVCTLLRVPPSSDEVNVRGLEAALLRSIQACEAVVGNLQTVQAEVDRTLTALHLLLQEMRRALRAEQLDLGGPLIPMGCVLWNRRVRPLSLHRDWVGAKEAAIRAGGTMLLFGLLWVWTGWGTIAFGMLGLSVMLLVFSAFESPHRTMVFVLRGQLIGAVLALLCQWLMWPWAQSGWQMVWMLLPFALMGGLVFAHKRTAAGAMDTNMAMLILLAPVFPYAADMGKSTTMALAVVSGPALAWLVYRWIYPTNAERRMRTLAQMMLAEVPAWAQYMLDYAQHGQHPIWLDNCSAAPAGFWQAQQHHRLLRLVRWADKNQHPARQQLPALGQALRNMQSTMLQLQQWRCTASGITPALRRAERRAVLALRRTAQVGAVQDPQAQAAAGRKVAQAWQALSTQSSLPAGLAMQAQDIAQRHWPVLWAAQLALQRD